ncbi:MAG TPA: serine hydrolase [Gammaproteobacteria bacterium]|nr:serine hydrolase [Gammaproteobacteria bacterium]
MKLQRIRAFLAILACAPGAAPLAARAAPPVPDPYPGGAAAYAVVVNGRLQWARHLDAQRAPASLTKLLTALVLLDGDHAPDRTITVSPRAARITGTRAGLKPGDALDFASALTAMLVSSANDACMALVEHAADTAELFAARMNARAAALGMRDSHFVQPCGLDAPGQHSTVRDLLRLSAAAVAEPMIAERAALPSAAIVLQGGRRIELHQSNLMVGRTPGVFGLKSGYTSQAGKCLILAAHRDDTEVWIVLLGAPDRWWFASGLLDEAFRQHAAQGPQAALRP